MAGPTPNRHQLRTFPRAGPPATEQGPDSRLTAPPTPLREKSAGPTSRAVRSTGEGAHAGQPESAIT
ncbi:hypothetical protein GCM10010502_01160 [Kitasatospora aureofaciens]|uniref:Uncharacterized protein n=1 Tax=Kitasatospora aureofaciens TaxID=1894 RepID=A0A8H9HBN9_KITAU|nr:hypothetical protein GCM10010502_01160 [Kitasatospora aureofaciens]